MYTLGCLTRLSQSVQEKRHGGGASRRCLGLSGSLDRATGAGIRESLHVRGNGGAPEHIRCVISIGMLTEGWDAKNVTHIFGYRRFGSLLLCEQVTGRALRRTSIVGESEMKKARDTPTSLACRTRSRAAAMWSRSRRHSHTRVFSVPEQGAVPHIFPERCRIP